MPRTAAFRFPERVGMTGVMFYDLSRMTTATSATVVPAKTGTQFIVGSAPLEPTYLGTVGRFKAVGPVPTPHHPRTVGRFKAARPEPTPRHPETVGRFKAARPEPTPHHPGTDTALRFRWSRLTVGHHRRFGAPPRPGGHAYMVDGGHATLCPPYMNLL